VKPSNGKSPKIKIEKSFLKTPLEKSGQKGSNFPKTLKALCLTIPQDCSKKSVFGNKISTQMAQKEIYLTPNRL